MSAERAASELAVAVLPLGQISAWQITLTAWVLKYEFGVKTIFLQPIKLPPQCFNAERNVYLANEILTFLFFHLPHNAQRIVGIIDGNLEDDGKKPCIGLADLYKRTMLCGVPRVPKQSRDLLTSKVTQDLISYIVITHEFIHTLGVAHCSHPNCVMNVASRSAVICSPCRRWVNRELMVRPGSAEERFAYAEALFFYCCFPQAIAAYREAIAGAPKEPLYHHRLGMAMYHAGQLNEVNQEIMLAIKLSNDGMHGYYNLGLMCLQNQWQLAESYFDKAIAVAKDSQNIQRLVGQAYREILHDVERASRHYKKYLRLGGDDQDVTEWLISRNQLDQL